MPKRSPPPALRIIVTYLVAASSWIVVSDALTQHWALKNRSSRPFHIDTFFFRVSLLKGLLFVAATGTLLALLIRRPMRELTDSSREVRSIIDSMLDGVILADPGLKIVDANHAAIELLGLPGRDAGIRLPLGRLANCLRPMTDTSGRLREIQGLARRAIAEGVTFKDLELTFEHPDGQTRWISLYASPVRIERLGPSQRPTSLAVLTLRDLTEIRKLEVVRDEFLSTAAHELKTPLTVIKANAQLLLEYGGGWDRSRTTRILRMIDEQTDRMNRLTQELLENSRVAVDRLDLHRLEIDLSDLIRRTVNRVGALSALHRFAVDAPAHFKIEADPTRIEQVVLNLLDNAIRYSPRGGDIRVKVDAGPTVLKVSIEDQGLGIPYPAQERIFEKFFRAHFGSSIDYGGMGIGLNLCREIVRKHGGEMSFQSVPGHGSIFTFTLPVREPARIEYAA